MKAAASKFAAAAGGCLCVVVVCELVLSVRADDDGSGSGNYAANASVFDKCAEKNQTERICGAAGKGVFFPVNPAAEAEWPKVRPILLLLTKSLASLPFFLKNSLPFLPRSQPSFSRRSSCCKQYLHREPTTNRPVCARLAADSCDVMRDQAATGVLLPPLVTRYKRGCAARGIPQSCWRCACQIKLDAAHRLDGVA